MTKPDDYNLDPRFVGAVDAIRRTGCQEFQIRYDEEQSPVVWVAVARHRLEAGTGRLMADRDPGIGRNSFTVAAGMDPLAAVLELAGKLIDGGTCAHCGKPTSFDPNFDGSFLEATICWTQWDPELATYRRGCE